MSFEKTMTEIRRIMKYETDMKKTFGKLEPIQEAITIVEQHLAACMEEKSVILSDAEREKVLRLVVILLDHAIVGEHTQIFRDFTFQCVRLLGNWNNNVCKCPSATLQLKALDRIMKDARTMRDTEYVLKRLVEYGRDMLKYKPPLFDVSRHYLESFDKDTDKKEGS
jgi:hypothetical protein